MSRLDELIKELCPDGVEYKELKEVLTIKNGKDYKVLDEGEYPVYGSGGIMTYVSEYAYNRPSVLIPRKGSIDKLYYVEEPFWNVDTIFYTEINITKVVPRYVYFCLQREHLEQYNTAGGVPSLTQKVLNKVKIPVPPLKVQNEIVRILDNFTELTAELTARQKQYEFYRDKLLDFGVLGGGTSECVWKTLGDVCNVVAGGTPSKKNVGYWGKGTIKWLGSTVCQNQKNIENITGYITEKGLAESSTKLMKKGTTLIALVGATIGKRAFLPFEAAINQNIAGIYPKNTHELNPSYVYYACALLYPKFLALTQGSKLAMANISFVRSLEIPVPSVRIQNRIVHVLDNFDAICSDLNIGLPAEIEARQKQYEYYRDMLLTFAESGNTISRAEQSRAEQSRAEQSRAEQSRAEQSRAEQSRAL